MEELKFVHKVSKGSKFNQIYIPSENVNFEPGDLVEVRLLKKKIKVHYSNTLKELSEFKKKLTEDVFSFLSDHREIKQIFLFGSFLTKKIDYNDIDLLILIEGQNKSFEESIYNRLIDRFNLNFHIIFFDEEKLMELLVYCPLTRGMLYYYVSDKDFEIPKQTRINGNHIRFLLMMPEDLLEVDLDTGIEYYNALRKLCVVGNFLNGKEISPGSIDLYLGNLLKDKLKLLKENEILDKNILINVKTVIKHKLEEIYGMIDNG